MEKLNTVDAMTRKSFEIYKNQFEVAPILVQLIQDVDGTFVTNNGQRLKFA